MRLSAALALTAAAGALSACEQPKIVAPMDRGVCYYVVPQEDGTARFHVVARDQQSLEYCAARLEEMRVRFLRQGGNRREVTGAYQGRFIWVSPRGVSVSEGWEGVRYFSLARTGDGRLAIPGAIQRDMDAAQSPAG